jgi:hypothetical protein
MQFSLLTFASLVSISLAQKAPDLSSTATTFPLGPDANSTLLKIQSAPGPYNVTIREDPNFPNRTIYVPQGIGLSNASVPLLAWGNGICYKYGRMYAAFLSEIASQGYLVIAPGAPNILGKNTTTAQWQLDSISYALNWTEAPFKVNKNAVAIGGHSCGGMESMSNLAKDKNGLIKTALILNSGAKNTTLDAITASLLIIHGGEKDVAAKPSESNFKYIVKNLPKLVAFKAVLETGHLGSFWSRPRGGIYAETSVKWLDWQLKGSKEAQKWFEGAGQSGAAKRGWKVESTGI